jgi:Predicted membrane protein
MTTRREKTILAVGIAVFVVAAFVVAVFKYQCLGYNGFDLAIYNQTFWNTIHGRLFATSINPPSYLGDHAEWLILALAPIYALVPHPLTLVFLKITAIALSAIPIWLITKLKFADPKTRLLFPLLWLVNPYVWNIALFEFHLITFAVPLTLLAAYFFLKDRWRAFIITALAILLCREDMAFMVVGFALLAIFETIRRRKKPIDLWRWAVVPIVLAATIFIIDQKVIAHFNPDGAYKFLIFYDWLGATIPAIIGAAFAHPLNVLSHLFSLTNFYFVFALMLPVFFLPFVRARFLLIIIIISAEYMLTKGGAEGVVLKTQYAAAFLPAVMLATIEGYERFMKMRRPFKIIPKQLVPLIIIIAGAYVWFVHGPGIGLANSFALPDARARAEQAAVSLIPHDAPVVASMDTLTQLSSRQNVWPIIYFWIGKKQFGTSDYSLPTAPEYLVLDQRDFIYFSLVYPNYVFAKPLYPVAPSRLRSFIAEGKYGVIFEREGVAVLKRGVGGPLPFVAIYDTKPSIINPMDIKMGPLNFLGRDQTHLFFSADRPVVDELVIKINNEYYPLGNGLYPTTDWKPGEIVEIAPPVASDKIEAQLFTIKGGLNVAADGSLIFSYDAEYPIGDKISLPQ